MGSIPTASTNFFFVEPLDRYCRDWSLSDARLLASTATSAVYRAAHAGQQVVLKVLTPAGKRDEALGALALRAFDGRGAVRLLRHDDGAHLMAFVDGPPLAELVEQGRDEDATHVIADVLTAVHAQALDVAGAHFPTLRERFASLFASERFAHARTIAERLLAEERDKRVLHGDVHHGNILHDGKLGWLLIDPKGLYGERTYDVANALFNPASFPSVVLNQERLRKMAGDLATRMNLELERLLAFAFVHGCLSAAWSLEDGEDPSLALALSHVIVGSSNSL